MCWLDWDCTAQLRGAGLVVDQSPAPGAPLDSGRDRRAHARPSAGERRGTMTVDQLLRALSRIVAFDERELSMGQAALQQTCVGVTLDSRRVTPGTVFVALRGLKVDGVEFAQQAIAAGAAAIVSEAVAPGASDVPWITVRRCPPRACTPRRRVQRPPKPPDARRRHHRNQREDDDRLPGERDPGSRRNQVRADGNGALSARQSRLRGHADDAGSVRTFRRSCARCWRPDVARA